MLKVLHLWIADSPSFGGGGAGSMFRLHCNLREAGVESRILCENKKTGSSYVSVKPTITKTERRVQRFTSRFGLNDIHRISSFSIKRHESYVEADIVNFHGIHSGFISYLALPSLTANKPAVFTLRDMWCLTGHCAISYDCDRWKIGCGKCPYPEAYPPIKRDATRLEWKLKNWAYSRSNLNIVALSHWLSEQAKQSMLNHFPIYHIPNGIDTEKLKPLDPAHCRAKLKIPTDKNVLMFAATHLNLYGKGGDLLSEALQRLPKSLKNKILLLVMGNSGEAITQGLEVQTINLGYVSSDHIKAEAYSASDLYVAPTRGESFGQVILESMACGTPVVSTNVGPVPELVRPGITGYLAEPESAKDLCKGVVQLLEDRLLLEHMGRRCRSIAVKEYSSNLETQRYIELYHNVLRAQN